jgi:gliding motility-associated-like protein
VASSGTPACTQTVTGSAIVTVNALPTASISGTTTICSGNTANVTFNGTANATVTYTINGGSNQTIELNASGTNSVTTPILTVNSTYALVSVASSGTPACTQTLTGSAIVTVNALTTPTVSFSYAQSCVNSLVSPTPILSTNFNTGGQFSSTTLNVNATTGMINLATATVGSHQVTYTLAPNTTNCLAAGNFTATIIILAGTTPDINFTYQNTYCHSILNDLPSHSAQFFIGGIFSSTSGLVINSATGEINISDSTPGNYTINYLVLPNATTCNLGGSSNFPITITSDFEIAVNAICDGQDLILESLPVNNSYNPSSVNYVWKNGIIVIGANNSTLNIDTYLAQNPSLSLPLNISVSVESSGCISTKNFTVENDPCKLIPRGISPNNDQVNDAFDLTGMGVNELTIYNRYGTEVYSFRGVYNDQWTGLTNNGNELPDATYFYSIHKNNGTIVTGWVYINRQY